MRIIETTNSRRAHATQRRTSLLLAVVIGSGAAFMAPLTAHAASGTWIGDGAAGGNDGGNWNDSTKWSGGTIADGADNTADFSTIDINASTTVTLNGSHIIGNLSFADATTPSNDYTLSSSGGSILTLQTTSGTPTITVAGGSGRSATISATLNGNQGLIKTGSGTLILSGNNTTTGSFYSGTTTVNQGTLSVRNSNAVGDVSLASGTTLNVGSSNNVTLSGNISGQGGLTIGNGSGAMTLLGDTTYSGGFSQTGGTLSLGTGTNLGLGTGTFSINGGRTQSSDNNSRTINNALANMSNNGFALGAAQGAVTGLGDLIFTTTTATSMGGGGSKTWTVNNATTATFNNPWTWTGGTGDTLTKAGSGSLVFNGSFTSAVSANFTVTGGTLAFKGTTYAYTGTTTITNDTANSLVGTLLINGNKSGTGDVNVTNGGTLGGTGSVSGNTFVTGGIIAPGQSPGTLTFTGNVSLDGASSLNFDLNAADQTVGGAVNDLISLTNAASTLTLDGTLNVTSGPLGPGTWRLVNYSGSLVDNGLAIGTISLAAGDTAQIDTSTLGQVNLVVSSAVPEPASLGLLTLGGLALLARRRRSPR
jgi:fibronectin-binding autotransporter adhesin